MPHFTRVPYAEMRPPAPEAALGQADDIVALAAALLGTGASVSTTAAPPFGPRAPVRGGSRATVVLSVSHEAGAPPVATGVLAGDLVGPGGTIPSAALTVAPATLSLCNGGTAEVRVTIAVPPDTPPGLYRGLIRTEIDDGFAETLQVEVVRP